MEITVNGNISIGTKVDVAAGATYIHTRIDHVDNYNYNESGDDALRPVAVNDIRSGLENYFGMGFRGRNPLKVDYLAQLAEDISAFELPKDQARIANMLYCSKEMINKPKSFSRWYGEFCRICGFKRHKYDQNKVDDFEFLKKRFYYLTF